jgi:hypothetical protein
VLFKNGLFDFIVQLRVRIVVWRYSKASLFDDKGSWAERDEKKQKGTAVHLRERKTNKSKTKSNAFEAKKALF